MNKLNMIEQWKMCIRNDCIEKQLDESAQKFRFIECENSTCRSKRCNRIKNKVKVLLGYIPN